MMWQKKEERGFPIGRLLIIQIMKIFSSMLKNNKYGLSHKSMLTHKLIFKFKEFKKC